MNHYHVKPNDLFLAYPGTQHDSRHFIPDAIARGASAIAYEPTAYQAPVQSVPMLPIANLKNRICEIAAEFYGYPGRKLTIIGVTGTNGKSSVCLFIAQALSHLKIRCGVISTIGYGIWPDLLTSTCTTPNPAFIQQQLFQWAQQSISHVVIEVSSHGLDQNRVYLPDVDIAVFTNLSHDHLDYHGNMDNYAAAKARLFQAPNLTAAVINQTDDYAQLMQNAVSKSASILLFSAQDVQATHLPGHFNQDNVAAVKAVLKSLHISTIDIDLAIDKLMPIPGRMELIKTADFATVVIDYAHTPAALRRLLETIHKNTQFYQGHLWLLFGCGGERDQKKRPIMAAIAERFADHIILTNDNPRSEDPLKIIDDIQQGFQSAPTFRVIADRRAAIQFALAHTDPTDVVVLAGKGHEIDQDVQGEKIPLNERTIVASLTQKG